MNSRPPLLIATAFAIGFFCAWLAKPGEVASQPEEASAARDDRPPSRSRVTRSASSLRKRAGDRLTEILNNRRDWQPEPDEDFPGLVAALQRRVGFSGLNSVNPGAEDALEKIVGSWYDADPDAALDWALGLENPWDATITMTEIIRRCAEKDWREAVALADQHGAAAGRKIDIPRILATEVMQTLSPEEFVRVERMFSFSGRFSKLHKIEIGDDFRFAETLDLYGGDKKPAAVLEEWARRDFAAAWEWANLRDEAQFKNSSTLGGMAKVWGAEADDQQVAAFAASLMGDSGPTRQRNLEIVGRLLKQSPTADTFQSVLAQAPGDRQENLNRLLKIGTSGYNREDQAFREELVFQMTKEECLAAFDSLSYIPKREFFDRTLTNFGYTDQEVARLLRKEESR